MKTEVLQDPNDRVIERFTKLIMEKPSFAYSYYNRGIVYFERHEYNNAIIDYSKTIKLRPNLVHPYNGQGSVYSQKGEYQRTIEDYNAAIERKPNFAEAYYNRGMTFLHLQEWRKAKSDLKSATDLANNIIVEILVKTTETLPTLNRNMVLNYQKTLPHC